MLNSLTVNSYYQKFSLFLLHSYLDDAVVAGRNRYSKTSSRSRSLFIHHSPNNTCLPVELNVMKITCIHPCPNYSSYSMQLPKSTFKLFRYNLSSLILPAILKRLLVPFTFFNYRASPCLAEWRIKIN